MKSLLKGFFILVAATLFTLSLKAQAFTFSRGSYAFWDTANLNNTWWRNVTQSMAATIDTAKGQIVIPHMQLWATVTTRRNLISGVNTNTGDTSITVSGNLTLKIVGKPLYYDFGVVYATLQDGIYALWMPNYLAVTYPKWNGYIRLIEFEK